MTKEGACPDCHRSSGNQDCGGFPRGIAAVWWLWLRFGDPAAMQREAHRDFGYRRFVRHEENGHLELTACIGSVPRADFPGHPDTRGHIKRAQELRGNTPQQDLLARKLHSYERRCQANLESAVDKRALVVRLPCILRIDMQGIVIT